MKKPLPKLVFHRLDAHAGGPWREACTLGALGQAGGLGDLDEQFQVGQVKVHGLFLVVSGKSIVGTGDLEPPASILPVTAGRAKPALVLPA
jgi:hypothetical protein